MFESEQKETQPNDPATDQGQPNDNDGNAGASDASERPSFELPDDFGFKTDDGRIDFDAIQSLATEHASLKEAADARTQGRPEDADGYEITAPEEPVTLADGSQLKFVQDDPLWGEFKAFAHEHALSQDAVNALVGLYARGVGSFDKAYAEQVGAARETAETAELAKLADPKEQDVGKAAEAGVQRWEAVESRLEDAFGDEGKAVAGQLRTAAAVKVFEALLDAAGDGPMGDSKSGGTGRENLPPQATMYPDDYRGAQ